MQKFFKIIFSMYQYISDNSIRKIEQLQLWGDSI